MVMQSKPILYVLYISVACLAAYFFVSQPFPNTTNDNEDENINKIVEGVVTRLELNHQLPPPSPRPRDADSTQDHSHHATNTRPRTMLHIGYEEPQRNLNVCRTPAEEWMPPVLPPSLQAAEQRDPGLIREIRDHWILAPDSQPLNLSYPIHKYHAQEGQDMVLDRFFHNKTGGFFIECGAFDGERLSNTLYFERERQWEGLLIEANPTSFRTIVSKHRKSYMLNACLSTTQQAGYMNYTQVVSHPYLSRLESGFVSRRQAIREMAGEVQYETSRVQCFPFYSILTALGVKKVDFFSLDVEGADWDVLQTIPFDDVEIDFMVIEISVGKGREPKIKRFGDYLAQFGYRTVDLEGGNMDVGMTRI